MEKGALVPDEVVVEVLKDRLSKVPKGKGFLLDGFPRTIAQADTLETITKIDVILNARRSRPNHHRTPNLTTDYARTAAQSTTSDS